MKAIKILAFVLLSGSFMSCEDTPGQEEDFIPKEPIFYYAGYSFTGNYGTIERKALLVINDSVVKLSPNNRSDAKTVYVTEKDIYIAGYQHNGTENTRVAYWKNGDISYLSTAALKNTATAILEDNGNLYVAGTVYEDNRPYQRLWINGEQKVNSGALAFSGIQAITVNDGDFLLAGQFAQAATIWDKEYMRTIANAPSEATFVKADHNDIWAIGYGNVDNTTDAAKVWKNREEVFSHPIGARVFSILGKMSGSDYYFAVNTATNGKYGVKVYKNKQLLYEPAKGQEVKAVAIQVFQNKVYVLGNILNGTKSIPTLWVDGIPKTLFAENQNMYLNHLYIR
ncbi:hypothetical protein [Empedobacter brevis]|uniref:hypothetical protein n=1 Tax=Empedobacter brevis TaxID=247 RepID=UPI0028965190|nr:hypothetical protein [Empedobacter brevis]